MLAFIAVCNPARKSVGGKRSARGESSTKAFERNRASPILARSPESIRRDHGTEHASAPRCASGHGREPWHSLSATRSVAVGYRFNPAVTRSLRHNLKLSSGLIRLTNSAIPVHPLVHFVIGLPSYWPGPFLTSGGCKFAVQGCEWYRLPERQFQVRGIVDGQAMGPR